MSAKVAQSIAIVSGGSPANLIVCALDRDEYTIASSGSAGSFSVNGHTRPGVHRLATGRFAAPAFVARLNRLEVTML